MVALPTTGLKGLLGSRLLSKRGVVSTDQLAGKITGLYFSAHWCPPCRMFTPRLMATYAKLRAEGRDFEVVFLSSDHDLQSFMEYFSAMPWLALPFEERDRKQMLSSRFNVSGIPTLVLIDDQGRVICPNGRDALLQDPDGFPWAPAALQFNGGETVYADDITQANRVQPADEPVGIADDGAAQRGVCDQARVNRILMKRAAVRARSALGPNHPSNQPRGGG